jgi:hypothetical protein
VNAAPRQEAALPVADPIPLTILRYPGSHRSWHDPAL